MIAKYAEVIVENRAVETSKPFTYIVKGNHRELIRPGMRVVVPFGLGNKKLIGLVVAVSETYNGNYKLKPILDIIDNRPLVDEKLLNLSKWISENYLSTYLDGLRLVLPPGDYKSLKTIVELEKDIEGVDLGPLGSEEISIINYIRSRENTLLEDLKEDLKLTNINKHINKLEDMKLIKLRVDISSKVNKKVEKWVEIINTEKNLKDLEKLVGTRAKKQVLVLKYLYDKGSSSIESLMKTLNITNSPIKGLEEKGLVRVFNKEVRRNPVKTKIDRYKKHKLNREQAYVYDQIIKEMDLDQGRDKFLIHGVTGSGKTEIYLQLVEKMIEEDKDSIILVPEISLTPQTIERFIGRFEKKVAILHSRLSDGERFDQWRLIKEGQVKIVVGARSAVFAPVKNLGLIVIDEEHEDSYKSSNNPKYDTIEVAKKRIQLENANLILGTATPSIETYYKARQGEYKLLELLDRVNKTFPEVFVADMREELNLGNKTIFSKKLYDEISENLRKKKQTILFLNRRGFTSFVSCRACGYVVKCEECDVSMTYHRNIARLKCHYCGSTKPIPNLCPNCKSNYIKHFGIGTEQVEYLTKEIFKTARVARMDTDTMVKKNSYEDTLTRMKNGEIDILIGTQMISKGLDFSGVTLVGIIAADTTLNLPDFRSSERSFQLTTQVAGRAGRDKDLGRVVIQTYNPDHYSIQYSKKHDFKGFYQEEIRLREAFSYPPFKNIISILIYGVNDFNVEKISKEIYTRLIKASENLDKFDHNKSIIGPYPAPLEKIRKNYRWYIVLKVDDYHMYEIKEIIRGICMGNIYKIDFNGVKISVDINPTAIL